MKIEKLLVFLLAACLLLTSCSKNNDNVETDTSDTEETTSMTTEKSVYDEPDIADGTVIHSSIYEYDLTQYINEIPYDMLFISKAFLESQINSEIEEFLQLYGTRVEYEADHVIEKGDYAEIYYTGRAHDSSVTLSESTLAGMTNASNESGYELLIGSNSFIGAYTSESEPEKNNPGFEDQIIGHKKGDKFTITVTFPDYYGSDELQGLVVDFDVTVVAVKKIAETDLTDELVSSNTNYQTSEEYRNDIYNYYLKNDAYDGISDSVEIKDLPEEIGDPDFVLTEYLFKDLDLEITQGQFEDMVNDHFSQYGNLYYYYYGISTVDELVSTLGKDALLINFERELVMDKLAEIIDVE